ncbi:MAG: PfkB family carbohydrate kinase, partial [Anaerolineales bacterium]
AQIASFYPGAMAYAAQISLRDLKQDPPDIVMISPNAPEAMIQYAGECQDMEIPYIYDPSQQIVRLSGDDLQRDIQGALALFVNDYEFALINKTTCWDQDQILANEALAFIVVTHGESGTRIYSEEGTYHIPIVEPKQISDPTGVGDAFRGGFLTGYSHGLDLNTCGRMGALAATYCLENHGPQGHSYTPGEYVQRYRSIFEDQGKLDIIMA